MSQDKLFNPYFPTFVKTLESSAVWYVSLNTCFPYTFLFTRIFKKTENDYLNTRTRRALLSMINVNV